MVKSSIYNGFFFFFFFYLQRSLSIQTVKMFITVEPNRQPNRWSDGGVPRRFGANRCPRLLILSMWSVVYKSFCPL